MCRKLQAVDTAAISQTLEMIRPDQMRKAAKMLRGAKRVLCMGQGGSMLIAEEAAHLFSTVGGKYQAVRDSHMQAIATVNADPEDVILYFSYSGSTVDMMHTLGIARRMGRGWCSSPASPSPPVPSWRMRSCSAAQTKAPCSLAPWPPRSPRCIFWTYFSRRSAGRTWKTPGGAASALPTPFRKSTCDFCKKFSELSPPGPPAAIFAGFSGADGCICSENLRLFENSTFCALGKVAKNDRIWTGPKA